MTALSLLLAGPILAGALTGIILARGELRGDAERTLAPARPQRAARLLRDRGREV